MKSLFVLVSAFLISNAALAGNCDVKINYWNTNTEDREFFKVKVTDLLQSKGYSVSNNETSPSELKIEVTSAHNSYTDIMVIFTMERNGYTPVIGSGIADGLFLGAKRGLKVATSRALKDFSRVLKTCK